MESLTLILNYGLPLALLLFAYIVGTLLERRHFANIEQREKAVRGFPVMTFENTPEAWQTSDVELLTGSVVISLDYFKRIIAGLRAIFGGRIKSYEPLRDRARREAMLRLVESAKRGGFNALINVRLETSRIANANGGEGTAGIEMLAFGTAIRVRNT